MKTGRMIVWCAVLILCVGFVLSGCAVNFYKQSPRSKAELAKLQQQVSELERQRQEEQAKFAAVKEMLEKKLKNQIDDEQVYLKMSDSGLVIVLSDEVLFDSGKADIKGSAEPMLDKMTEIIIREVPDKNVGISGHTDNVPITYSNWKSNWELSSARAMTVLHYMEGQGVPSERLSATGYGEYRPVSSNSTAKGRARNRRVEIVILPEFAETQYEETEGGQLK
jgi:chemotaxis protein MotB